MVTVGIGRGDREIPGPNMDTKNRIRLGFYLMSGYIIYICFQNDDLSTEFATI